MGDTLQETLQTFESIFRKYTTGELRQLAIYLGEFQDYTFITPSNERLKKCWLNSLTTMLLQKDLPTRSPTVIRQYLARIKTNIEWFVDHKISLRRRMKSSRVFYNIIAVVIARRVTDTVIHFKSRLSTIDILRSDLILPDNIMEDFNTYPNTIDPDDFDQTFPKVKLPPLLQTVESDEEITDETRILECKVCMTNKICTVLTKCGHTFCYTCTTRIDNKCATCRTPFTDATKVRMYI